MSTTDVPESNPHNNDRLRAGCWAEHQDGSLILVQSAEGDRVIYDVFDLRQGEVTKSVMEYRDVQLKKKFMADFSYAPEKDRKDGVSEKWTWHDKTGFPWQRVIDAGMEVAKLKKVDPVVATAEKLGTTINQVSGDADIVPFETSQELLTAAQRVAKTLKLKGKEFEPTNHEHLAPAKRGRTSKASIMDRMRNALGALRG